jgi:hypothetical protein
MCVRHVETIMNSFVGKALPRRTTQHYLLRVYSAALKHAELSLTAARPTPQRRSRRTWRPINAAPDFSPVTTGPGRWMAPSFPRQWVASRQRLETYQGVPLRFHTRRHPMPQPSTSASSTPFLRWTTFELLVPNQLLPFQVRRVPSSPRLSRHSSARRLPHEERRSAQLPGPLFSSSQPSSLARIDLGPPLRRSRRKQQRGSTSDNVASSRP